jgi:hypothetical protein
VTDDATRADRLADFRQWLEDWSRAYPEDMFPPVDMRAVMADERVYSHAEVLSIAQRNAAAMGRHLLAKVIERASEL